MTDLAYVGKSVPRVDAPEKVTGRAMYTLDLLLPRMLHGRLLGSPVPHARIRSIDVSRAEKLPGVKLVMTARDIPDDVVWGVVPVCYDQRPLATDKVRFVGDSVAAVVATSEDAALEALDLIDVDYEELPAVFDPFEAMREGAPAGPATGPSFRASAREALARSRLTRLSSFPIRASSPAAIFPAFSRESRASSLSLPSSSRARAKASASR